MIKFEVTSSRSSRPGASPFSTDSFVWESLTQGTVEISEAPAFFGTELTYVYTPVLYNTAVVAARAPGGMRHAVLLSLPACCSPGVAIAMSDFGGAQKPMKSGLNSQQMHARTIAIARSGFGGDTVLRVQTWGR